MHGGNFNLVLHTHLPWVLNHGAWPHGEDWLYEAVAECYVPLLNVFNDLVAEGIPPRVTLDISPVLCEQLAHPDMPAKFINYCNEMIAAAKKDKDDFSQWGYDAHHIYLTEFWANWYTERRDDFIKKYDKNVIGALKSLQDKDAIEIMTCGATHGYFAILGTEESIEMQVITAINNYEKHFGRKPRGMWLPECAYRPAYEWHSYIPVNPFHHKRLRPGVEQILFEHNIDYFITDQELLDNSYPIGRFEDDEKTDFMPINRLDYIPKPWNFDKNPLRLHLAASSEKVEFGYAAAFTRHRDIAMQVWSGEVGYPAEADYLDFHKKHMASKLRYWRVTDKKADMMYKTLYHPDWVFHKLDMQANHFIHQIENTINYHHNQTGIFGTLCAPFDTELFGHWWFEGPEFIRMVLKGLNNSPWVNSATLSEQYDRVKPKEVMRFPEGSWGENNNHDVWMNSDTEWTWECIYNNEYRFSRILNKYPIDSMNKVMTRIMKQAMRELLLLQASDWQFLIHTWSARDYAEQRFFYHHNDFNRLCDLANKYYNSSKLDSHDEQYLEQCEKRNAVFTEIELSSWRQPDFSYADEYRDILDGRKDKKLFRPNTDKK